MVICVSGTMQFELSKERQVRKKKARTWTEAAKLALELYPKTPMGHKDIFNVIRAKGLKDVSGPASLACLNAMLQVHSRGPEAMFYRVDGCTSVFGLASNIPEGGVKMEIDEDDSEEFDPGDSDPDSGASISPCGRKKDRVLYVRLPPGFKNFSLSNNNAFCNLQNDEILKSDQLTVKPLTYKNEYCTRIRRMNGENMSEDAKKEKFNQSSAANLNVTSPAKVSQSHSQRAIKHALRQQQKRRRRNTAIAASGSAPPPIPRIIMKSLPPAPTGAGCVPEERWRCSIEKTSLRESTRHKPQTMRELLASIPGLSFKPRKRSNRKLSTAAQIAQTKKGCINIETPDSILVNTNLRALLNKHTFASLPAVYQYRLVQLLPQADRMIGPDYSVRLTATALSNEFFARACQEWKRRLQEGEFTPENQMKLKGEAERDHSKLDPWKIHNFEPVWGHTALSDLSEQNKTSSFIIKPSLNNQNKHVPTIKIKPVVRKSRLSTRITRHRKASDHDSPSHSDENHPVVDLCYEEAVNMDTGIIDDNSENLYGPPPKKLKGAENVSSHSSESQDSSEESLQAIAQNSPSLSRSSSPVTSTVSPSDSLDKTESSKEPVAVLTVVPTSLSVSVAQATATSQSFVPPITIRSVPIVRTSSKKNSKSDNGLNLERSYQICKAALESTTKKNEVSSGKVSPDSDASIVTSSVTSVGSPELNPARDNATIILSERSPVQMVDTFINIQDTESSMNHLLLTTYSPPAAVNNTVSSSVNNLETSNLSPATEISSVDTVVVESEKESSMLETADALNDLVYSVNVLVDSQEMEAMPVSPSNAVQESEIVFNEVAVESPESLNNDTAVESPTESLTNETSVESPTESLNNETTVESPIEMLNVETTIKSPTGSFTDNAEHVSKSHIEVIAEPMVKLVYDKTADSSDGKLIVGCLPEKLSSLTNVEYTVEILTAKIIPSKILPSVEFPTKNLISDKIVESSSPAEPINMDVDSFSDNVTSEEIVNSPSEMTKEISACLPLENSCNKFSTQPSSVVTGEFTANTPKVASKIAAISEELLENEVAIDSSKLLGNNIVDSQEMLDNKMANDPQELLDNEMHVDSQELLDNEMVVDSQELSDNELPDDSQELSDNEIADDSQELIDNYMAIDSLIEEPRNLVIDSPKELLPTENIANSLPELSNVNAENSLTDTVDNAISYEPPEQELHHIGTESSVESSPLHLRSKESAFVADFSSDLENNNSTVNTVTPENSPFEKPLAEEDSIENSLSSVDKVALESSEQLVSCINVDETNNSSSTLLQNDVNSVPSECLDSDSSSMQPTYNNSQVVDEDNTIILSLPSSEEESATADTSTVATENIPEKEINVDNTNSRLSISEDSVNSYVSIQPTVAEEMKENLDVETPQLEVENNENKIKTMLINDNEKCEVSSTQDDPCAKSVERDKQFEPPSRPMSAPNFTPEQRNASSEVNSLKRPSSCQSYYRSAKVTPIVYFDSPESDDAKSDCDKTEDVQLSPASSSVSVSISSTSAYSLPTSTDSLVHKETSVSVAETNCESQISVELNEEVSNSELQVTQTAQGCDSPASRSSASVRSVSTPSSSSMQSMSPVFYRPLSNPNLEANIINQANKTNTDFQNCIPVSNPLSLPEGCTGGTGGSLPSQAVSVVPAATQLPIASGDVIFPSANGLSNTIGTPAGDTPPRSLLQSSPVINGASSGMEGAVTSSGGDSGGGNNSSGNGNNCACNLKAMVMCLKCGAFCHDDCIGPSRLCVTCLIR